MPHRQWQFRVGDNISAAIASIQGYVSGMSYDDFIADRKTVDAVIRNFIVIGEAAGISRTKYVRHIRNCRGKTCGQCGIS